MRGGDKVMYLHGRPMAHPMHKLLAESLGSDFYPVDQYLRWQDRNKSVLYRILSWLINALTYPIGAYNYLLVDNLHFSPIIAKKLGLLRKRKTIVHLGSHTLFFMYTNRFSPWVNLLHRYALKNYDYLLCEGKMAAELVEKVLGKQHPKTYITYLGVPSERYNILKNIQPDLYSKSVIIIANGPTEFREWYKGLDLMLKAFGLAFESIPDLKLIILGNWDVHIIERNLKGLSKEAVNSIVFVGSVGNIDSYLASSTLCLHCTRGDAFPTSTLEAMAAGVVPVVSEWTGTKEVIKKVDKYLVSSLDEESISARIKWYFSLDMSIREKLSSKCREQVLNFTEEAAINLYHQTFKDIQLHDKLKKVYPFSTIL